MEMDNKEVLSIKVIIDCPVCSTQNRFLLEDNHDRFACEDCGFCFLDESKNNADIVKDRCLFCGSKTFYYEAPFSLSILGYDSVCYVCGARYKDIKINEPDRRYSEQTYQDMCKTKISLQWQERIKEAQ